VNQPDPIRALIPKPPSTPAEVLRGTARYLTAFGWIQNDFYADDSDTPAACVAGAMALVAIGERRDNEADIGNPDDPSIDPLLREAARWMGTALVRTYGMGVLGFNDHPGQQAAIVVDHLRQVANAWDAAHPDTTLQVMP
jgi:hypothetical protein